MQLKPIAVAAVLLLVIASLSVSGCTTSETNQTPSASATPRAATHNATTTQHDAFLEKYLAAYKNESYANSTVRVTAWELKWVNSTSARLQMTILLGPTNTTYNYESTYIVFPTSQDATTFVNTVTKTGYSLATTTYTSGGSYQRVTGHAPQIYREYVLNEINTSNPTEYKLHQVIQEDNLVITSTGQVAIS